MCQILPGMKQEHLEDPPIRMATEDSGADSGTLPWKLVVYLIWLPAVIYCLPENLAKSILLV